MTQEYNWKKTVKKFGWSALFIVISGGIVYLTDNPYYIGLIPVLEAGRNFVKHRLGWL